MQNSCPINQACEMSRVASCIRINMIVVPRPGTKFSSPMSLVFCLESGSKHVTIWREHKTRNKYEKHRCKRWWDHDMGWRKFEWTHQPTHFYQCTMNKLQMLKYAVMKFVISMSSYLQVQSVTSSF